jgi:thioredoxin 1
MTLQLDHFTELTRDQVAALRGPTVVEFGTPWCGYCRGAQPLIAWVLEDHPAVRHLKIEDGKGRPLGRFFRVKLWPTLVFLKNGVEVARLVRPTDSTELRAALALIDPEPAVDHNG